MPATALNFQAMCQVLSVLTLFKRSFMSVILGLFNSSTILSETITKKEKLVQEGDVFIKHTYGKP